MEPKSWTETSQTPSQNKSFLLLNSSLKKFLESNENESPTFYRTFGYSKRQFIEL
jgi:hypothetical protein